MPDLSDTRASLILRLPDRQDVEAWDDMVALYAPVVFRLARSQGIQPADADDLVQEVFAAVERSIDAWLERDDRGRFRAWLFRIAKNTSINFLTRRKHRPLASGGSDVQQQLANVPQQDGNDERFEFEWQRQVFQLAAQRVQTTVSPATWQAFQDTTLNDRSVEDTASELGVSVGSVYIARSRVMAKLRTLVQQIQEAQQ